MEKFDPDLRLDYLEKAHLHQVYAMPGYHVMHRLFRSEVDKFIVALINTDPSEPEKVITAQLLAKAAAQFYTGITNRINEEIVQYTAAPRAGDKPVDLTEGMLDMETLAEEEYE